MPEPAFQKGDAVTGRLAPSPTGAQHLGNARTYLLAWLSARSQGGKVVLRMEDIDSPRTKAGAAQQAITDLSWLGLDWDEGPDIGGPNEPYVQTDRTDRYTAGLRELAEKDLLYPCTCTRADVEAAGSAPHFEQEGPVYPGTCAHHSMADFRKLADGPLCLRFRTNNAELQMADQFLGPQTCRLSEDLGDFVIARWPGKESVGALPHDSMSAFSPSYQLAVVVDDFAMGVTEVVRGDDLLPSMFRQQAIYDAFGWQPPSFAHVPLVVGEDGRRLAKRHGDTRLATFREKGVSPRRLLGVLAWSCGLREEPVDCDPADLIAGFSLDLLPQQPFVVGKDVERLLGLE